jgi:hypothetical protein
MDVRLTVAEGPSTSRKIRVRVSSVPIRFFFARQGPCRACLRQPYFLQASIPTCRVSVAFDHAKQSWRPSLFMLSFGLFSRRHLGPNLPNFGLGAPPARSRRRRHHLFPLPYRTARSLRLLTHAALSIASVDPTLLIPYFTIMYFHQSVCSPM